MEQVIETVNVFLFSAGVCMLLYRSNGRYSIHGSWDNVWNRNKESRRQTGQRAWELVKESHLIQPFISTWMRFCMEQKEREIYEGISYLRNLVNVGNGYNVGGDYVLEELSQLGGSMQIHYIQLLHFLRSNECERGLDRFAKEVGTDSAAEYGRILIQWDQVKSESLADTLQLYQCSIQERMVTLRRHRDELLSDLIYLPVVVNVMVLLVNFVYVAYFLDQKRMLLTMFQ